MENVSSDTYLYDHEKSMAFKLASMKSSRYAFSYTELNGEIYALGGGTSDEEGELITLKECEKFNI